MNSLRALGRIARGTLGIALLWAIAWIPLGLVLSAPLILSLQLTDLQPSEAAVRLALAKEVLGQLRDVMVAGAVAGTAFAAILSLAERGRALSQLPTARIVVWGVLAALALPVGLLVYLCCPIHVAAYGYVVIAAGAATGALCAVGTLVLARRDATPAGAGVAT